MISYSYRKDIDRIFLFYPEYTSNGKEVIHHQFDLLDAQDNEKIILDAVTLFVLMDYVDFKKDKSISELFAATEHRLRDQLTHLFGANND